MESACSDSILFYAPEGPFGWLSTFSAHQLVIRCEQWPTVEHFFQAQKFTEPVLQRLIKCASSPAEAKALATARKSERRLDWHSVRDQVMLEALRAKFAQHPKLSEALRQTDDRCLVENSLDDWYWGAGANGTGRNRLGELLMLIREELRKSHGHEG